MKVSELTFASPHSLMAGDLISMDVPDRRRWKRLLYWILRRDPPTVRRYFTVGADFSLSVVSIEGAEHVR